MGMTQGEKVQPLISIRLHEALEGARQGRYQDALSVVKEARTSDPRNIYVIAFQKQIEKLLDISQGGTTHGEQQGEIIQSLPPIVERAVQSSRSPQRPISTPPPASSAEKEAALEKLERMYLHRADEYLDKGDYDHAMAEVRRVYIIHPASIEAKSYEKRIETGISLKSSQPPEPPAAPPKRETKPPAEPAVHSEGRVAAEQEAPRRRESRGLEPAPALRTTGSRTSLWVVISVMGLVLAVLGGYFLLKGGNSDGKLQSQKPQDASQQTSNAGNSAQQQQDTPREAQIENIQITPPDRTNSETANREKGGLTLQVQSDPRRSQDDAAGRRVTQNETPQGNQGIVADRVPAPEVSKIRTIARGTLNAGSVSPVPTTTLSLGERLPSLKRLEMPRYPELAEKTGAEGKVTVRVQISPQGKPIQIKILQSTNPIFNEVAIEAVMKSEFNPGVMASGPVTSWINIPFNFSRP